MRFNQPRGFLLYVCRTRLPYVVVVAVVSVAYLIKRAGLDDVKNIWSEVEPLISFVTFITALAVFLWEAWQDWKGDLPKKLTVIFEYDGSEVMRCNRADLVSEADMRALGQQIGSQMAKGYRDLKFRAASVKPSGGRIASDADGSLFRDYTVTFELTELPPTLQPSTHILWNPPFDRMDTTGNGTV